MSTVGFIPSFALLPRRPEARRRDGGGALTPTKCKTSDISVHFNTLSSSDVAPRAGEMLTWIPRRNSRQNYG